MTRSRLLTVNTMCIIMVIVFSTNTHGQTTQPGDQSDVTVEQIPATQPAHATTQAAKPPEVPAYLKAEIKPAKTPKEAFLNVLKCLYQGKEEPLAALFDFRSQINASFYEIVRIRVNMSADATTTAKLIREKYGETSANTFLTQQSTQFMPGFDADGIKVNMLDEKTATLVMPMLDHNIDVNKIDGVWKLDFSESEFLNEEDIRQALRYHQAMMIAYDLMPDLVDEHKNYDAFQMAFHQVMSEAIASTFEIDEGIQYSTTQPDEVNATQPAND